MNKTIKSLAKKYQDAVADVSNETGNGDGWWIYLQEPHFNPQLECSIIHEDTLTECIKILKDVVNNPVTKEEYFARFEKTNQ